MGGWAMVDPDDVVHRRPNKHLLKCIFAMSSGRQGGTSL